MVGQLSSCNALEPKLLAGDEIQKAKETIQESATVTIT